MTLWSPEPRTAAKPVGSTLVRVTGSAAAATVSGGVSVTAIDTWTSPAPRATRAALGARRGRWIGFGSGHYTVVPEHRKAAESGRPDPRRPSSDVADELVHGHRREQERHVGDRVAEDLHRLLSGRLAQQSHGEPDEDRAEDDGRDQVQVTHVRD